MTFTPKEIERWHKERRQREAKPDFVFNAAPVAICIHCQNAFGINEGVVTDEVVLCDICNGN